MWWSLTNLLPGSYTLETRVTQDRTGLNNDVLLHTSHFVVHAPQRRRLGTRSSLIGCKLKSIQVDAKQWGNFVSPNYQVAAIWEEGPLVVLLGNDRWNQVLAVQVMAQHRWNLALIFAAIMCSRFTTLVMMHRSAMLSRVPYLLSLSWSASSTFVTFLCVGIPQLHPCMHIHMLARTHASMQAQTHAQPHVLHAAIQRPCMLGMPWVHVPWHARARTHTNPPRPPASPPPHTPTHPCACP